MARQTIVSTQQAERITDRALRHIRPIFGKCYGYPKYHDLWHVEQSFRMSKTDLRARPIFHRTRDAIEAHLTIVFAALAVARCVQDRTGVAIARVVKQLRPLRTSTIAVNAAVQDFPPQIPAADQEILSRLGFEAGY
ncbi:hypothetical protein AIIKEEIJ_03453 [Rhodococcus sp. YH1]|nr:hypothetical protein [Rhodococcus sp. YH1]